MCRFSIIQTDTMYYLARLGVTGLIETLVLSRLSTASAKFPLKRLTVIFSGKYPRIPENAVAIDFEISILVKLSEP